MQDIVVPQIFTENKCTFAPQFALQMFQFKQFAISQDKCGMKISSSACMLGSLAQVKQGTQHILDIGTGTGLLALMLAQRVDCEIDAIEIDAEAASQAAQNFASSPWANRLQVIEADITRWAFETAKKYDMIVCNPPFFRTATLSLDKKRRLARHENSLEVPVLAEIAATLLAEKGDIWLLIAAESYSYYGAIFGEKGFFICHEIALWDSPEAEKAFCYILHFSREATEKLPEKVYFRTAKNGEYAPEYVAAMKEYLVIF